MCGSLNLAQRSFFLSDAEVMWLLSARHSMHAVYQPPLAQAQGTPPKREYKERKTRERGKRAVTHCLWMWQGVALVRDSQQPWPSAQDLRKIKPVNIPAWAGEKPQGLIPIRGNADCVHNNCGKHSQPGKFFSSGEMAMVGCSYLSR